MSLPQRDPQYHTYGEYLRWTENQREELIDGISYIREPPAPLWRHQGFVRELLYQLRAALGDKPWSVQVAPCDVRLPKSDEADEDIDTVVQPDVFIVRDRNKIDALGVRGAPDWIAEVLSPATARHDQVVKLAAFERAGVREVWYVHPTELTLAIYVLDGNRYGRPAVLGLEGRTPLTAVPGLVIDWDRLLRDIA